MERGSGTSAEALRRRNAAMDARLFEILASVPEAHLHDEYPGVQRTLAEQLGHLGEFPLALAAQVNDWLASRRAVLGRVGECNADHADAIERATMRRLNDLTNEVHRAAETLADTLRRLSDDHVHTAVIHVSMGRMPLITFIEGEVIEHKAAHVDELARTLADL